MFLDDEAPLRNRPWKAVVPLLAAAALHLALALRAFGSGTPEVLPLALAVALAMAAANPFRSEAGLLGVVVGDLGALLWGPSDLVSRSVHAAGALVAGMLLVWSWRAARRRTESRQRPLAELLGEALTQRGETLLDLSRRQPLLLVCLRHFGCVFCRESLTRLAEARPAIAARGTRIVLVHQGSEAQAADFFAGYGVGDLDRVSDPLRWLYFHLGLRRGGPWQLLGPKVWIRAIGAGLLKRHGLGRVVGDLRQMPGVFLIRDGVVLASFVSRTAADNPDFQSLAQCPG